MNKTRGSWLFLMFGAALMLVACARGGDAQATAEEQVTNDLVEEVAESSTPAPSATLTSAPTETPTLTSEPASTAEPSASVEPPATAEPPPLTPPGVQTMNAILAPPGFELGELESYTVESSGLTFDYPAGWVVTEDEATGLRIESEAGIGDRIADANGASVSILSVAADELAGETLVEKLASFIIAHGMPATTQLGQPQGAIINEQELIFSAFVDTSVGLEGVYALYSAGDEMAVIFAVAGGQSRVSYRPAVETIVDSIILPQTE